MKIPSYHKSILLYLAALLCAAGAGCNKFLDVKPKGKDIPVKIAHFNGLFNNNALLGLQNFQINEGSLTLLGNLSLPLYMSDDILSSEPYFSSMDLAQQRAYKWQPDVYLPDDDAAEWGTPYVENYIFNLVANNVMNAEDGTPEEKKQLLAEARVNRAFMHFLAVNLFARPYTAAGAADPGVPVVTVASTGITGFKRGTVKEVYDFIVNELTAAVPDLKERTRSRVRIYKTAGYCILGKVYLFMGEYDKALAQLNLAFQQLSNSDVALALNDYNTGISSWYNTGAPHRGLSGYPLVFNDQETIFVKQMSAALFATFGNYLYLKPEIWQLFGEHDLRKHIYSNRDYMTGGTLLPGYQRASPFSINFGPSLADLYLMRAECKARLNDLEGARTDLETFRKSRMPAADAVVAANTREDMVKAVLDERLREFAATGLRWFDMRRLSVDPEFNNVKGTHQLGNDNYTLTPERLALKIPPKIRAYNPDMEDNP